MPDPNITQQARTISLAKQREIIQDVYDHQVWCPDAPTCLICCLLRRVLGYYPRSYDHWTGVKRDA